MARRRNLNLGWGSNPDNVNLSALPPQAAGQLGGTYEQGANRWQFVQLLDGAGAAGDVVYTSAYDSLYKATTTIGNSSNGEVAGIITTAVTQNYYTCVRKGGLFNVKANGLFARGTQVCGDSASNRVVPAGTTVFGALVASDALGGILSWQNPYSHTVEVDRLILDTTVKSTGASTADFGWTTTSGATSSDLLLDGVDLGTAIGTFDNIINKGVNGLATNNVPSGKWVTGSKASGAMAGLVGTYTLRFVPLINLPLKPIGVAQGAINTGKVSTALDIPYV